MSIYSMFGDVPSAPYADNQVLETSRLAGTDVEDAVDVTDANNHMITRTTSST